MKKSLITGAGILRTSITLPHIFDISIVYPLGELIRLGGVGKGCKGFAVASPSLSPPLQQAKLMNNSGRLSYEH